MSIQSAMHAYKSVGSLTQQVNHKAKTMENGQNIQNGTAFASSFENAIKKVANAQNTSNEMTKAYELGIETDIAKVMIARQKSSVAFTATTQVRNKVLEAYKQVMSMPV